MQEAKIAEAQGELDILALKGVDVTAERRFFRCLTEASAVRPFYRLHPPPPESPRPPPPCPFQTDKDKKPILVDELLEPAKLPLEWEQVSGGVSPISHHLETTRNLKLFVQCREIHRDSENIPLSVVSKLQEIGDTNSNHNHNHNNHNYNHNDNNDNNNNHKVDGR
jgi:hypothetical protein